MAFQSKRRGYRRYVTCRKAVSGAITGIFIILILMLVMGSVLSYQAMQDQYNHVVNARNQLDWERFNENIEITDVEVVVTDNTLNATVQNLGSVNTHLVSCWLSAFNSSGDPRWQKQYAIDIWLSSGDEKYCFGQNAYNYSLIKPGFAPVLVDSIDLTEVPHGWTYALKIVTERGNVAIYRPIPNERSPSGAGFYPIVIAAEPHNFEYTDLVYSYGVWTDAWIKPNNQNELQRPLYRVLVNNTTSKDIVLDGSSFMLQSGGTNNERCRFIVSHLAWPEGQESPAIFVSLTIPSHDWAYVYFAAKTKLDPGSDWQMDPNLDHCPISFLINFRYSGESELRTLGLPVQVQQFI